MISTSQRSAELVVTVGSRFFSVPLAHVIETTRPLLWALSAIAPFGFVAPLALPGQAPAALLQ